MAIADELIALLGYELTGEDAAKRYEGTLKRLEKTATRVGAAIGTAIKVGTAVAAAGFSFLGKSVIETSAAFEGYEAALTTIEGSAEKARQSLDWISEFGKTTPYDVAGVTDAFIKLKSYGIDPIADEALRTLGDAASAMNKPLNQAVEAFADASTFQFERLREFGITTAQKGQEVTFSWTKNGEQLSRVVKKNGEDIRRFLLENLGERFSGAMLRQSKTWNGMLSNLGDSWTDFLSRIGEGGFFDTVKSYLGDLLDLLARLDADGTLEQWSKNLSDAFTFVAETVKAVATRIAENIKFLSDNFDTLKPILIAVGIALGALFVMAFPVVSAFAAIGLAVDDLIAYLQGGESVIGDFIEWCKKLPDALMEAAGAFGTWLSNIDWGQLGRDAGRLLVDALVLAISTQLEMAGAISDAVMGSFSSISWGDVWNIVTAGLEASKDLFLGFWEGIGVRVIELINEWFDIDLVAMGQKLGNDILTGLQSLGDAIKSWFMGLFQLPQWLRDFLGEGGPGATPGDPAKATVRPSSSPAEDKAAYDAAHTPVSLDEEAWAYKMQLQQEEWQRMLDNAGKNIAKMAPDQAVEATITDARTDARSFPVENTVSITQNVTQASDAPRRAADATGAAVSGALASQRSQIETGPSF
jgi:hypothetical protein